jgi:calcineurin-like phosphoesterase family protein
MTVFFTSDTHFGHARIIELCKRPFVSVEDMNEALIANWNARVHPGDTVWHLGDFTLGNADAARRVISRLHGDIHLVWGNHDRESVRNLNMWRSSQYAAEINHEGHKITLCHYAMRVWNQSHRGSLMLYGHSHGHMWGTRQSLDVGVDCWGFKPITLPEILLSLKANLPDSRSLLTPIDG